MTEILCDVFRHGQMGGWEQVGDISISLSALFMMRDNETDFVLTRS